MPEYLAPGVYVEETSFRAKSTTRSIRSSVASGSASNTYETSAAARCARRAGPAPFASACTGDK